ncbi:MAG: carboxypeptidase-like regulatory domain-containing protein [Candidatus Bathyarchaeia archaeon]|nr:carboxypeptidase regulatory-like domain-containing protein [Candidatus Bathyarchaeota archaeon]
MKRKYIFIINFIILMLTFITPLFAEYYYPYTQINPPPPPIDIKKVYTGYESREIIINNTLPIDLSYEPIFIDVEFSYGEAINGSISLKNSEGLPVPFQILNEEFYKGTPYYKTLRLTFLASVAKNELEKFILEYSATNKYVYTYNIKSDLIVKDKNISINIENSFYNIEIQKNSTRGIKWLSIKDIEGNSIIDPIVSFPGVYLHSEDLGVITNDRFIYPKLRITLNGTLVSEVQYNGTYDFVRIEGSFKFFAYNPTIVYEGMLYSDAFSKFKFIYPLYFAIPKGVFTKLYLYNSNIELDLTSIKGRISYSSSNLIYLYNDEYGFIIYFQPINFTTSRLIIQSEAVDYIILALQANNTTLPKSGYIMYKSIFRVTKNKLSKEYLDALLLLFKQGLKIDLKKPFAKIEAEAPLSIIIDTNIDLKTKVICYERMRNLWLNVTCYRLEDDLKPYLNLTATYIGELKKGDIKRYSWNIKFNKEGSYLVTILLYNQVNVSYAFIQLNVTLPSIMPYVDLNIQLLDFDGEDKIDNSLNVISIKLEGLTSKYLYISSVNSSGFKYIQVYPDIYKLTILFENISIIGEEIIPIYRPTFVNIKCFLYDFKIKILGWNKTPLSDCKVILNLLGNFSKSIIYRNITDATGTAIFKNIFNGTYRVDVISKTGSKLASFHIDVIKDDMIYELLVEKVIEEENYLEIYINNTLPVDYHREYVEISALFSFGIAINGSLKLIDNNMFTIPFQIIEAEYYPDTSYYKYVKMIFPIDISRYENKTYRLYYSLSKPRETYNVTTDLKVSNIINEKYVVIENSFYKAYVNVNSSVGISRLIDSIEGVDLIDPSWGFPNIRLILTNGSTIDSISLDRVDEWKLIKGPLMAEVRYSTSYGKLEFNVLIRFYAYAPYIDSEIYVKCMETGTMIPIHILLPKNLFHKCYVYNTTEELYIPRAGLGVSIPTSDLIYLSSQDGKEGLIIYLKPSELISRIILKSDIPSYDLIAFQRIPISTSLIEKYSCRLQIVNTPITRMNLTNYLTNMKYRPIVYIKNPPILISIISPSTIEVDREFEFKINLIPLVDIDNVTISIESHTRHMESLEETTRILYNLRYESTYDLIWHLKFTREGNYLLTVFINSSVGNSYAYFPITTRLPYLLPFVDITFRAVDYDGNSTIPTRYPISMIIESMEYKREIYTLTLNQTGYCKAKLDPGLYCVRILADSKLIGYWEGLIESSTVIPIRTWAYDVGVKITDSLGKPLPNLLVVLVSNDNQHITYANTTGIDGWAKIDDVFNGTYTIYVVGGLGEIFLKQCINIQMDGEAFNLSLVTLNVKVKVVDLENDPLYNATVYIIEPEKGVMRIGYTDIHGYTTFNYIPSGIYSIRVEYLGELVYSQDSIEITQDIEEVNVVAKVVSLTIIPLDLWLNTLRDSIVEVTHVRIVTTPMYRLEEKVFTLRFEQRGIDVVRVKLPLNRIYEVHVLSGLYEYRDRVELTDTTILSARCGFIVNLYGYMGVFTGIWVALAFIWRHRTREVSAEYSKLKSMLSKLERLYANGEIEEKIYRKLKAEYTEKLRRIAKEG